MADLGTITYTSVSWTAGDVITEAKLDNMVANDQAYDSHAAQGLLLNNNKAYCAKDSGGTARNIAKINTSDVLEIGDSNILTALKATAKASVYLGANQDNLTKDVMIKVNLDTELYDPGDNFDAVTNHRFIAPVTGYYSVKAAIKYTSVVADKRYEIFIKKNDTDWVAENRGQAAIAQDLSVVVAKDIYLEKNNFIELYARHWAGVNTVDIVGVEGSTFMTVHLLSID